MKNRKVESRVPEMKKTGRETVREKSEGPMVYFMS